MSYGLFPLFVSPTHQLKQITCAEIFSSIKISTRQQHFKKARSKASNYPWMIHLTITQSSEEKKIKYKKPDSSSVKYRKKKIIKKGAILYKDNKYYLSPRAFIAMVSHDPKNYFSEVLNLFDEEVFFIEI